MMKSLLIAPAVVLTLIGCGGGPAGDSRSSYLVGQVNITDSGLSSVITRLPITEKTDQYGILTATVPLRVNSDESQEVDYRFTFFDANHVPQDTNPAYQHATLHANSTDTLQGMAPMPHATDFTIDIRPAE